jgi:response regulator RpfG family c-di-GMP phosphodiesterase
MKTILCIDDEPMILKALKRELHGVARILIADSAAEGLRVLADESVDVVISDCRMPVMSGVELMHTLRVTYPNVVRVLLTGCADVEMTLAAINDGQVYRFITKPWKRDELLAIVKHCLEHAARLADAEKVDSRPAQRRVVALDGLESAYPGISSQPKRHGGAIEIDASLLEDELSATLASLCN